MESSKRKTKHLIDQFCAVTGATRDVGEHLLEACSWDVQLAIEMHMEEGRQSPGATGSSSDEVRAPIPQTQEVLVEDTYGGVSFRGRKRKGRSVFDGFRDFQAEAHVGVRRSERIKQQEEEMRAGASGSSGLTRTARKTRTLQDLFRPPIDITYKGTFENAREAGTNQGKWLMVNIQNVQEFSCQALNRDVWSNSAVKALIREHFIFWQVYHDSDEGEKYCNFYKTTEWPYVAVLDPQTGENLITWSRIESTTFCDLVSEFLSQHPCVESVSPPSKKTKHEDNIVDATEDDQLKAAIQASLSDMTKTKDEDSVDTDSCSDLETFTDSDDDVTSSPVLTRASPHRSSLSSNVSAHKGSFEMVSKSSKKQSGVVDTSRTKNGRCESPLPCASSKSCSTKARNTSPFNPQRDSSPRKCSSPSISHSSPCKKNSPYCAKNSPQKSIDSPKKSSSIHNDVHPAVIAKRQSLNESKQVSGDGVEENKGSDIGTVSDDKSCKSAESVSCTETETRDYRHYLGNESDEKVNIMLRLPDGQRERLSIPFSSQLLAVVVFVSTKGFTQEEYELVAHFPHRQLSQLSHTSTLTEIGLNAQETIFVQKRV